MTKQAKTLNERELQRLLDYVAKTKQAKRNRTILLLTHLAGMRIGEVAALRVCDVLASDNTVRDEINLILNPPRKSKKGEPVAPDGPVLSVLFTSFIIQ